MRCPHPLATVACVALLLASGCTSFDAYSAWRLRNGCLALDRCTVYDASGEHEVPCVWTRHGAIYAGDPGWPFTPPNACDAVLAAEKPQATASAP